MPASVTLMPTSEGHLNFTGEPYEADGWYGFSDGLHTVSIHTDNLTGRVYVEASLVRNPTEADWFPVWLTDETSYVQFPLNPFDPTGINGGDTGVTAYSFRSNVLWVRARLDRSYLPGDYTTDEQINNLGAVRKILMGR